MTVADVIDRAASERLIDAIAGEGALSELLRRRALEFADMTWRGRTYITTEDVEALHRWLTNEWVDWLLLRTRGVRGELRFGAGRLLDQIETIDVVDLRGIATFLLTLYVSPDRDWTMAPVRRYRSLYHPL